MNVVLLIKDLIFSRMIRENASARPGIVLRSAHSRDEYLKACAEIKPDLVIADLNMRGVDVIAILAEPLAEAAPRVLCFFSHVDIELEHRARGAGLSEVVPRSQFTKMLPQLFKVLPSTAAGAQAKV